jgi:hypothetical protein
VKIDKSHEVVAWRPGSRLNLVHSTFCYNRSKMKPKATTMETLVGPGNGPIRSRIRDSDLLSC